MRVLLADSNHPILHETLESAGFHCDLFWERSAAELIQLLPAYDALVLRSKFKVTAQLLDTCPKLKCIGRVGAGMENIDLTYAATKNIVCLSVPEGNRDAVAEHAIGMLLMLLNNLKRADDEVRKGIWKRAENRGHEIMGKTVGIIGLGNTGTAFAKKLVGFECRILAYDKYKSNFSENYIKEATMEEIFAESDIVSLHLPLTPETMGLADSTFFSRFNKPIYFINTARGNCVSTADLVKAIESNQVTGACLDVLEYETATFETTAASEKNETLKYLKQSDKVILSPHIAGWTHESNYKMSRFVAEKIIRVLKT